MTVFELYTYATDLKYFNSMTQKNSLEKQFFKALYLRSKKVHYRKLIYELSIRWRLHYKLGKQFQQSIELSQYNAQNETESETSENVLKFINVNPHTSDRFTPSHARCAENCGSALTHR